jgi:hypothetical protein
MNFTLLTVVSGNPLRGFPETNVHYFYRDMKGAILNKRRGNPVCCRAIFLVKRRGKPLWLPFFDAQSI